MTTPLNISVLGAGIMGLMAAYALRKDGHNITIHDPKGFPANNASAMAGGMLAPYSEIEHMDESWIEAGLSGIDLWKEMPFECGLHQNGSLLIACTEDRYILERFKTHLPEDLKTPRAIEGLEPALSQKFQYGLYLNEEAHLDPRITMKSLINTLKENGVQFSSTAAKTDDLKIDCRGLGAEDKNLRGVKGEILIVRNPDFKLHRPVRIMHPRYPLYIIPREDNIFMIGATQIESAENTNVSIRSGMELMGALYALSPSFADAEILEIKAGIRPSYPDNLPRITIDENTISCNGLFRHGYLLSPVMAQCVADHLAGRGNKFMSLFNKGSNDESHNQRAA